MINRSQLPTPATAIDMYLNDIAQSLRDLVDLVTAPALQPPVAEELVELREPEAKAGKGKRKPSHRDEPRDDDDVLRPDLSGEE